MQVESHKKKKKTGAIYQKVGAMVVFILLI